MEYTIPQLESFSKKLAELNNYDDEYNTNKPLEGEDAVKGLQAMGLLGEI